MNAAILQISYLCCAGAFLILSALVVRHWQKSSYSLALLVAALTTTVWAVGILQQQNLIDYPWVTITLEVLRISTWLILLATLHGILRAESGLFGKNAFLLIMGLVLGIIIGAQYGLTDMLGLAPADRALITNAGFISLSVLGLLLLENLFRNTLQDSRWAIKFLCFGLGTIFAYDFFYYADSLLFRGLTDTLFEARGFVNTLAVPLIVIAITRARTWSESIHISRSVVFHTAALVACGLYLLIMAAAGYYVQVFGGEWGTVIQITFLSGAILLLFVLFSSESLRTKLRLFIARNFYSAKYDYRAEWLRFIDTLSQKEQGESLQLRIIHALSTVVNSRGGALFIHDDAANTFSPQASWNFGEDLPSLNDTAPFIHEIATEKQILPIEDHAKTLLTSQDDPFAKWLLGTQYAWFALPMFHENKLMAFMLFGHPRVEHALTWEDEELLTTLAQQAASYLAEEHATNALVDARQFEAFNKRFAFVVHDIKNIINQLSLLVKNAEAHGQNPEFQADMIETVAASTDRMSQLLVQLKNKRTTQTGDFKEITLAPCLTKIAQTWRENGKHLDLDLTSTPASILGNEEQLVSAIDHLIQNALDACDDDDKVILRSSVDRTDAHIEIRDTGPGMDEAFVRTELFRPLSSTKSKGFGVGVYQVREYIQSMGGELKVTTAPGQGTAMRIILPLLEPKVESRALQ